MFIVFNSESSVIETLIGLILRLSSYALMEWWNLKGLNGVIERLLTLNREYYLKNDTGPK
jgi:hypothetical protein